MPCLGYGLRCHEKAFGVPWGRQYFNDLPYTAVTSVPAVSRRRCRTGWVSEGLPETLPHHFRCRLAFMVSYPLNPQPTPPLSG